MGTIDTAAIAALTKAIAGQIIQTTDPAYDESRELFNGAIDKKPGVIVKPSSADDVAAAIRWARDLGLEISVKSGGHGVVGHALTDGGLTLDMRSMNSVSVDPEKRIARVGGGARWGEFDEATQQHALGATGGRVSTTGVAGLTLGGGSGWVERKYGLACDNLRAAELVTASGELVRASDDENPDLLWALRGGGGNFGVATALEFEVYPLGPEIFIALMLYDVSDAEALAHNYRAFMADAPEEVGGGIAFLTAPPEEFVPEDRQGTVMAGQIITWCGPVDQAEKALAPLLRFGNPIVNVAMPIPYLEFQRMLDDPPGFRNYWTAEYVDELPDEGIEVWARYGREQRPSPTQLIWLPWGGAIKRGPDSPMRAREANWVFHPLSLWESADDDEWWMNWSRNSRQEISRFAIGTAYMNFQSDATDDKVAAAFGKDVYERLAEIKGTFDPDNVFHLNNNIKPRKASEPVG